ncbi:MAG: efflux RND transporter periplasmic adaptor subunit [Candidatus Acidiferrales bacterium]
MRFTFPQLRAQVRFLPPVRHAGLLLALAATVLAVAVAGCGRNQAEENPNIPATPVQTVVVRDVPISDDSEFLATLKSRHSSALNPQVEGQVTRILVKSGDRVAAGGKLMEIDPLRQQATVQGQQASIAAQKANVELAQIQFDRAQKLSEAGVIAKQELDQAQTNLATAKEQQHALEAQLNEGQVTLHYYSVVSPTNGIVGDIPVRVGDRVTVSTMLTTIDEPGNLEVYVNVPVDRAPSLKMGQLIQLLDDAGNVAAETHIDFISSEVDTTTQSVLVKATLKNSSGALRTSQFARVRIVWGVHQGAVLPVLAVSRINGEFFAFVVDTSVKPPVAHQKIVKLGELKNNQYAVISGLAPGDHVVVEGGQNLVDGAPVAETVQPPDAKP